MLAVGDGATRLQLLAPLSPTSPIAAFLDRKGPGIQQIAYTVDDIEAASATLRERGLRLLYDEPRRGTAGSRINFVHPKDAGGVLVELVEPAADSLAFGSTRDPGGQMDEIRAAILSGEPGALAGLPVPESYRGVVVRADEVGMFEGLATRDKDPRQSLHVQDVPTPESARAKPSSR